MRVKPFIAVLTASTLLTPVATQVMFPVVSHAAALPVVKFGDKGSAVTTLQQALNAVGFPCGTPDGVFGNGTKQAVVAFQTAKHLTADGIVGSGTWSALGVKDISSTNPSSSSSPSRRDLEQKEIWLNGKLSSSPMAFVWNNTTYMPVWYVQAALNSINIKSEYDGAHGIWNLKVPDGVQPDFKNPPIDPGNGKFVIEINGTAVKRTDGIVYKDPATNYKTDTMYMPIWYVMVALERIGVTKPSDWDGQRWNLVSPNVTLSAYNSDSTKIGDYPSLDAAKASIAQLPGAFVKDGLGNMVYQTPDFSGYASPTQKVGDFVSLQSATNAIAGQGTGYVVDTIANTVVTMPQDYYFIDAAGKWESHASGVTGLPVPSFAKSGEKYFAVQGNPTQYYLLVTSDNHYSGQVAGTSLNPFQTVDLRSMSPSTVTGPQIDTWLTQQNSPLSGLGASYVRAQNTYGVNSTYLLAHSILETGWGTSAIYHNKNNLFGYGAFDTDPGNYAGIFPSSDYAIQFEAWVVRKNYLEQNGSFYWNMPTLTGMNHYYATDKNWSLGIAQIMDQYVSANGSSASAYKQYQPGSPAAVPAVSDEPVFLLNGAVGTVQGSPYGNLPVFADTNTGADQMFPGVMQVGSAGRGVSLLQKALGITADGIFGPNTQAAVTTFQSGRGLPTTGVCDVVTWNALYPMPAQSLPAGTQVQVDMMMQGIVGGAVTEWYHVTGNGLTGWVDSHYVTFTNVYRLQTNAGYNANVYASNNRASAVIGTIHAGDYVVAATPTPDGSGFIAVQWVNPATNQRQNAYLDGSVAHLTLVQPATTTP